MFILSPLKMQEKEVWYRVFSIAARSAQDRLSLLFWSTLRVCYCVGGGVRAVQDHMSFGFALAKCSFAGFYVVVFHGLDASKDNKKHARRSIDMSGRAV